VEVGHLEERLEVVEVGAGGAAGAVEERHGRAEADVVAHRGEQVPGRRALGGQAGEPVEVGGVKVSPRDVVAATLPDPAELGDKMRGRTCAGTWVKGRGKDGRPREVYVYHVVDNAWSMREFGHQAVVWQTAVMPAVAIELMSTGVWSGIGVVGPEALPSEPFLDLLDQHGMEWDWAEYRDKAPFPEAERGAEAASSA